MFVRSSYLPKQFTVTDPEVALLMVRKALHRRTLGSATAREPVPFCRSSSSRDLTPSQQNGAVNFRRLAGGKDIDRSSERTVWV